ncbi:hypothetical protein CARUB_v100106240mg, partial [Capsella rubella]
EMITMRRNILEGKNYRSSKMRFGGSVSKQCHSRSYNEIVTTYYFPEYPSSPVTRCDSYDVCYSCTPCLKAKVCISYRGAPPRCTITEECCLIVYP